nr:MAG TPA: hypothetical protein [Caudoviricetes sp.]
MPLDFFRFPYLGAIHLPPCSSMRFRFTHV